MQKIEGPSDPAEMAGAEQSHKTTNSPAVEEWLSPRKENAQRKAEQKQQRLKAALRSNLRRRKEMTGLSD